MPNLIFLVSLSGTETEMGDTEASLEGWLQTPSKQNIRRHGWKKLYVVVSKRKIIFFNSEMDKQNSDPTLILDLNKVCDLQNILESCILLTLISCAGVPREICHPGRRHPS